MLELVRLTAPESAATLGERMRALDPILLQNALAFGLDCPTLEKQSLLEAADPLVAKRPAAALAELPDRRSAPSRGPEERQLKKHEFCA